MEAIEPNLAALGSFTALSALTCLALLIVAGMFPLHHRPAAARAPGGPSLLGCNLLLLPALAVGTAVYGWMELRWATLVISCGLVFLLAPLLLDRLPAGWRDGRTGLAGLLLAQGGALFLLLRSLVPLNIL